MYSFSDIRSRVDFIFEKLGYFWLKEELIYGEIPAVYWSNGVFCVRVRITERQNSVDCDITNFQEILPPSFDERWISLFTFSSEYKRRMGMPLSELVKLIPIKLASCADQIDAVALELPDLLRQASIEMNEKRRS